MGLEDELEARYPALRRPPEHSEAERLVGDCLTLFSEAARVLSKHGVPTTTLVRRRPRPEGFWQRVAFDGRPKPVAEGWQLCWELWVDTGGRPWVTTQYVSEGTEDNPYPDRNYEQVPLDVDEWVREFSGEGEQIFAPVVLVNFSKRYDDDGRPHVFMEDLYDSGLGPRGEGPVEEIFMAAVVDQLRHRTR